MTLETATTVLIQPEMVAESEARLTTYIVDIRLTCSLVGNFLLLEPASGRHVH
jgi:hypothetical protein